MRSRHGKTRNKKLLQKAKINMEFNPTLNQPILNQIYNSWDIHGDERRIGVKKENNHDG